MKRNHIIKSEDIMCLPFERRLWKYYLDILRRLRLKHHPPALGKFWAAFGEHRRSEDFEEPIKRL